MFKLFGCSSLLNAPAVLEVVFRVTVSAVRNSCRVLSSLAHIVLLALQEAKASLEAAVPGVLQKDEACKLRYMIGIITHSGNHEN